MARYTNVSVGCSTPALPKSASTLTVIDLSTPEIHYPHHTAAHGGYGSLTDWPSRSNLSHVSHLRHRRCTAMGWRHRPHRNGSTTNALDTLWLDQLKFSPGVERRVFVGSFWIALMLFGLVAANLFIPRFFCRVLCPLGALLGFLSRFSLFRIHRDIEKCTQCNLCATRCEGACDPNNKVRQSECFSCMNCLDDCPEDALSFRMIGLSTKQVVKGPTLSRRQALFGVAAGLLGAPVVKNHGMNTDKHFSPTLVRPPGSVAEPEFLERCVKCGQCINVCPTNVLQPATTAPGGLEALWTPVMNYELGHCQLKCTLCSEVCPTGAIRKITVEEKLGKGRYQQQGPIRLGTAFYNRGRCLPHAMEIPCVVCEEVCPVSPKLSRPMTKKLKMFSAISLF